MTDKEILKKAIQKAYDNGFKKEKPYYVYPDDIGILVGDLEEPCVVGITYFSEIIFSHDFAKAFWGEKIIDEDREIYGSTCFLYWYRWQLHLSELVLKDEPLKYIEKFLDD